MSAAAATATSQVTEMTNYHQQQHCPDIVVSCSPDSDDDDDNDDVSGVDQVSSAFDDLLNQHGRQPGAATLDDVIGDVTRLRDVIEGDTGRAVNRELLAAECRQLVVDCKQLVSSVFYCSTSDMTLYANRALHSLSAVVRHSQNVTAPAQQLVSNVRRVVSAFEATITAAKEAVGSPRAGVLELANFIKQASTLARCLQLLLSNIVDVKS